MQRLAGLFASAAAGSFPPVDGAVEVVPAPADLDLEAVVEFTGHGLVATALPAAEVHARGYDAFGGIVSPDFLRWLAGPGGEIGSHDAVLVRSGTGRPNLAARTNLDEHPRVKAARRRRRNVTVYGDESGLITVGLGLADRWEVSVELLPGTEFGTGAGRALISEAVGHIPDAEPVFASVAPGNAASLRAFLACGFKPIGAEVIIYPGR
ncbi:MAG: GNAT family N-acetyltransferase [Acidimicrobiia bacterium]